MRKFLFRQAANLIQLFEPKLNILIYHRVMPAPDPLRPWEIDKNQFRQHMEWISGVFNVVPLSEAVEALQNGTLKRRSLSITFDDGYLDNTTEALPILNEFGFHATFFCTSAWLDGGLMWNDNIIETIRKWPEPTITIEELGLNQLPVINDEDKNAAINKILPKLKYQEHSKRQQLAETLVNNVDDLPTLMMRPEHIKQLHTDGMEIGCHTHSHPIISNLNDIQLSLELNKNKQFLETIIGQQIKAFAYPNGKPKIDYQPNQLQLIEKNGFKFAVTTENSIVKLKSNPFELPRFTPWDKLENRFLARLITLDMNSC